MYLQEGAGFRELLPRRQQVLQLALTTKWGAFLPADRDQGSRLLASGNRGLLAGVKLQDLVFHLSREHGLS